MSVSKPEWECWCRDSDDESEKDFTETEVALMPVYLVDEGP